MKSLAKSIEEDLQPVYLVLSEAAPLRDRALEQVVRAVEPMMGAPAFNHSRFRASDANADEAFSAARMVPVMGERRLVEVRDLQEGSKPFFQAMLGYLENPSPDAVVIIVGTKFPKVEKGGSNWSVRIKRAMKNAERGMFLQLEPRELPPATFAMQTAEKLNKTLKRPDAKRLVELVGSDLGRIEQEVGKLATYVGEEPAIRASDIDEATASLAEAVVRDLTTGLVARDANQTLAAAQRLQDGGDDPRKLLGLILWQMRELLHAAEMLRQGASDTKVTQATRIRSDVFRRIRPTLASGFPHGADLLRRIATANRQMNSHRANPDRLLEGLLLEMLNGQLRRPPAVPRPR